MVKIKEFKSPTNDVVRAISNDMFHIYLISDTWTPVREECWQSAYSQGCISKDMSRIGADPEQAIAQMKAQEVAYEARVREVMKQLMEDGDPETLDAKGRPIVGVIGEIVGTIPSASLRNRIFNEIQVGTS